MLCVEPIISRFLLSATAARRLTIVCFAAQASPGSNTAQRTLAAEVTQLVHGGSSFDLALWCTGACAADISPFPPPTSRLFGLLPPQSLA